jgi:hypothetical protein
MRIIDTGKSSISLHISTRYCDYKDDKNFYNLSLIDPIIIQKGYHCLLSLASAEIPFGFYCVNEYNNKLIITENSVEINHIIPLGNYSQTTLKSTLSTLLGNNYLITYNQINYKFTIKNLVNITSIFKFSSSSCTELIGFNKTDLTIFQNQEITSQNIINLNYTNSLYLLSDITDRGSIDSQTKTNSNILQKIPINTFPGGMIYYYNNQTAHKILFHSSIINNIRFALCDDEKRPIDMNGQHYEISLLFDFIEEKLENPYTSNLGERSTFDPTGETREIATKLRSETS